MASARGYLLIASSIFALAGCQGVQLPDMKTINPLQSLTTKAGDEATGNAPATTELPSLADMIGTAGAKVNVDVGFKAATSVAINNDPQVIAAANELRRVGRR